MQPIPKEFRAVGSTFRLLERHGDMALYAQWVDEGDGTVVESREPDAYEVHKIRVEKARTVTFPNGEVRDFPEREVLASNEMFGMYGWSYQQKENALKKMEKLL